MNLLLDTHLLIWAAGQPARLSPRAVALIAAPENRLWHSVASLWEIAIKQALRRPDFPFEMPVLRAGLLANGYQELDIAGRHIAALNDLAPLHRDPFDRLLIAQAQADGMVLLTVDRQVADYGGPVEFVG